MAVLLSHQTKVNVVRVDNMYHVCVDLESGNYIHHFSFETIRDAVELASLVLKLRKIDLNHWRRQASTDNLAGKFLIQNRKKSKAHLWIGLDTFCKMWSTGGLGAGYDLFDTDLGKDICTMCYGFYRDNRR